MVLHFAPGWKVDAFMFWICWFCSAMLQLAIWNLSDNRYVFNGCLSTKYALMNALDESGINKDFTEKSIDWIATAGKRSRSNISYSAPPPLSLVSCHPSGTGDTVDHWPLGFREQSPPLRALHSGVVSFEGGREYCLTFALLVSNLSPRPY